MPADRLTLAIRVGGQNQRVVTPECVGDRTDVLLRLAVDLPAHREAAVGVDGSVPGREIPHVSAGREYGEVLSEIPVDGFRLGWRFDHYDGHGTTFESRDDALAGQMTVPKGECQCQ